MDDYIKREDAIVAAMDYDGSGNAQDVSQDIAAEFASIPAADVRENVRGEWIEEKVEVGRLFGTVIRCPVCGERQEYKTNFCPDCGADMRGEKDDKR